MKQPIAGLSGIKPRLLKSNGKLSGEEARKLDREYRVHRNEALQLRNYREKMLLAKARGELIPKEMAQQQAQFLVLALRARLTAIPQSYARALLNIADYETMAAALKKMSLSILREIENLPRVVEEGYVDRGEDVEEPTK